MGGKSTFSQLMSLLCLLAWSLLSDGTVRQFTSWRLIHSKANRELPFLFLPGNVVSKEHWTWARLRGEPSSERRVCLASGQEGRGPPASPELSRGGRFQERAHMGAQKLAVGSFRAAGPCQSLESSGAPQGEHCWRRRALAWGVGGQTFLD